MLVLRMIDPEKLTTKQKFNLYNNTSMEAHEWLGEKVKAIKESAT